MTAPPPVSRILETSLYVEDLDRSVAFYQRLFGFEVMLHDFRMAALAVPGREVLLLFRKGASTQPSDTPFGLMDVKVDASIDVVSLVNRTPA